MSKDKLDKNWKNSSNKNNWAPTKSPGGNKLFISGLLIGISIGIFIGSLI